jgi:hypothetical protein
LLNAVHLARDHRAPTHQTCKAPHVHSHHTLNPWIQATTKTWQGTGTGTHTSCMRLPKESGRTTPHTRVINNTPQRLQTACIVIAAAHTAPAITSVTCLAHPRTHVLHTARRLLTSTTPAHWGQHTTQPLATHPELQNAWQQHVATCCCCCCSAQHALACTQLVDRHTATAPTAPASRAQPPAEPAPGEGLRREAGT